MLAFSGLALGNNTGYFSVYNAGSVPGIKRPKSDNEHLFQSSAWVKNTWSYTSNIPYASMFCIGATLSGTSWHV